MSSNADKRSVSTDALETLGTVIGPDEKRDAIHIAVEPVIAKEHLRPGDHVSPTGCYLNPGDPDAVGIVDPFLQCRVQPGQRFWLLIYPRKIKSLRHVWSHPAFPDEPGISSTQPAVTPKVTEATPAIEAAKDWIESYAGELGLTYEELMEGADKYVLRGEYFVPDRDGGMLEGISTKEEFWVYYDTVRGTHVAPDKRDNFFSCSC